MQYDYILTCECECLVSFRKEADEECTDADAFRIEKAFCEAKGVSAYNVTCEDGIVYADVLLTFEDYVEFECDRKNYDCGVWDACVDYENEVRAGGTDAFLDALWQPTPTGYKMDVESIDSVKVY